ncbi:MAG: glycosyltransferase, partial [bacterium]
MTAIALEPDRPLERAAIAPPLLRWCIVTCEYPPLAGGVSDHTRLLAEALAASGDAVDVWCPPAPAAPPPTPGVAVHVLPSHFGLDALRVLGRALRALPADTRVLVQYVPTGYGWRMMNVPFALLLFSLRRRGFDLYVHEVAMPVRRG